MDILGLFLKVLLYFSIFYSAGILLTGYLVWQTVNKEMEKWELKLMDSQVIFWHQDKTIKNKEDLEKFRQGKRWQIIILVSLGWFLFLRPLILKKLNKEF